MTQQRTKNKKDTIEKKKRQKKEKEDNRAKRKVGILVRDRDRDMQSTSVDNLKGGYESIAQILSGTDTLNRKNVPAVAEEPSALKGTESDLDF